MAEESLRTIEGAGANPHKVLIDAEEFLAWCREHNKLNESGTRAEFTSLRNV